MRFCILDPHAYELVRDHHGLILDWDAGLIAERVYPRKLQSRKRRTLERNLVPVLEAMKRDLFAH
jgi:hypothetical protein